MRPGRATVGCACHRGAVMGCELCKWADGRLCVPPAGCEPCKWAVMSTGSGHARCECRMSAVMSAVVGCDVTVRSQSCYDVSCGGL